MARSSTERKQSRTLLLIEDNPGDARLLKEAFSDPALTDALRIVSTGADALDFVHQRGEYSDAPLPDLILLDWNLPGMDGADVLAELNGDPDLNHVPVIVLTGSQAEQDIRDSYQQNANACITKEASPAELEETIRAFEKFWFSAARLPSSEQDR